MVSQCITSADIRQQTLDIVTANVNLGIVIVAAIIAVVFVIKPISQKIVNHFQAEG